MRDSLTDRQKRVLEFIRRSTTARGYPPTLREIGEELGIRSTNGVSDHLKALERKGYLERDDFRSRALRPIGMSRGKRPANSTGAEPDQPPLPVPTSGDMVSIPLLGRVAAGQPILAVENVETTVQVDRYFVGKSEELFALRVRGDSMIEAGICDGDFIFVQKQLQARPGQIVVALIEEEATVKYYHPEGDRIRFEAANPAYGPIVVHRRDWKSVDLLGIVVGVYRQLNS
jgi:repressor LexA